jgi:O-antigen/teichoic acid export membrane protein
LIGPAWSYGMKSYIANLFTIAAMRIGILFVNHELGTEQAGLYSTAQQVMELLIIVPSVLGTVLFGRISDGKSNHLTGKLVRVVIIAYLPVIIGLSLFTDSIISLLFGHPFVAATTATRIMLPGSFLLGLEVILVNDLRGRGYPWNAVLVWIPVSVISAVGYAVLIPRFGLNGAAIVTTASYAAVFFYICVCYRRMSNESLAQTFVPSIEDLKAVWQAARGASGIISEARLLRKEYARTPAADQDSTEIERSGAPR